MCIKFHWKIVFVWRWNACVCVSARCAGRFECVIYTFCELYYTIWEWGGGGRKSRYQKDRCAYDVFIIL